MAKRRKGSDVHICLIRVRLVKGSEVVDMMALVSMILKRKGRSSSDNYAPAWGNSDLYS